MDLDYIFGLVILPWLNLAAAIAGTIGNIFVFLIYSRSLMTKTSLSIYFRALSVLDTLSLLNILLAEFIRYKLNYNLDIPWCPCSRYFGFNLRPMGAWLQVLISLDRFLNIAYPRRFPIFASKTFQMALTSAFIVYNLIVYTPLLWNSYLLLPNEPIIDVLNANGTQVINLNGTWCAIKGNFWTLFKELDFYNYLIVPFTLMILLSVILIVSLVRTRSRARQRPTSVRGARSTRSANSTSSSVLNKRDRRFAITILAINFIFLVMVLPQALYNVIAVYSFYVTLFNYLQWLASAHSGTSFYVQVGTNSLFRQEFCDLIGLKLTTRRPTNAPAQNRAVVAVTAGANAPKATTTKKS